MPTDVLMSALHSTTSPLTASHLSISHARLPPGDRPTLLAELQSNGCAGAPSAAAGSRSDDLGLLPANAGPPHRAVLAGPAGRAEGAAGGGLPGPPMEAGLLDTVTRWVSLSLTPPLQPSTSGSDRPPPLAPNGGARPAEPTRGHERERAAPPPHEVPNGFAGKGLSGLNDAGLSVAEGKGGKTGGQTAPPLSQPMQPPPPPGEPRVAGRRGSYSAADQLAPLSQSAAGPPAPHAAADRLAMSNPPEEVAEFSRRPSLNCVRRPDEPDGPDGMAGPGRRGPYEAAGRSASLSDASALHLGPPLGSMSRSKLLVEQEVPPPPPPHPYFLQLFFGGFRLSLGFDRQLFF